MRAGLLNRRLHLQRNAMISDVEGVSGENWSDVDLVWAQINPVGGREVSQAGQAEELISHQIVIRWRPDVSVRMRFVWQVGPQPSANDRIFLIHSMVDPDEMFREIDCLCEEIVTAEVGAT